MKLRNLLIIAALFCLSASAFAGVTWWDQDAEQSAFDHDYDDDNNGTGKTKTWNVSWKITVANSISSYVQPKLSLFTVTGGVDNQFLPSVTSRDADTDGIWWVLEGNEGSREITIGQDLGLWITDTRTGQKYFTNESSFSSSQGLWRQTDEYTFTYTFGGIKDTKLTAVVTFAPVPSDPLPQQGQPLPAPVTTLLIALAFGGAFVMYRNRKQVKA